MDALGTALGVLALVGSFVAYLWLTRRIGYAAEAKGRSFTAWALIAMFFGFVIPLVGLIIPAIMVAAMKTAPDEVSPSSDEPAAAPSERLRQLKQLYDEGLVSEEEYTEKRQDLLDQL